MDSTSIITQVNKDDESAEVSPYTQNKREYAFTTSILLTLLRYKYAVTGANFASQGFVSVVSLTSPIENSPKLSLFELFYFKLWQKSLFVVNQVSENRYSSFWFYQLS